jgi:hypothetical protein
MTDIRRLLSAVLVASVVAFPAVASAQFPSRGGGFGRPGGGFGRSRPLPPNGAAALPTSGELTKEDPILVLLGNKTALSLADSQVTQLERLDAELVDQNRPLLADVDSLNATMPKKDPSGSGDQTGPSIDVRRAFANAIHQIRENDRVAMERSLELLNEDQRAKAEKLLQSEREKRDKNEKRQSSPLRP